MTYSEKLERIPSDHSQSLRDSLIELQGSNKLIGESQLARRSGIPESEVQVLVAKWCQEDILKSFVEIRCPECGQHHGDFESKNEIPDNEIRCFDCATDIDPDSRFNWSFKYQIKEGCSEFFPEIEDRLKHISSTDPEMTATDLRREFKNLESVQNNKKRGRMLDHFVGIIFCQIKGADVYINQQADAGEFDVFVSLLDVNESVSRLLGDAVVLENKWTNKPIGTDEIFKFHGKCEFMNTKYKMVYFLSMSGFTSQGTLDAKSLASSMDDPKLVLMERGNIEEMIENGEPVEVLRDLQVG